MEYIEMADEAYYRYACRCGDWFELSLGQLESGINAVECTSCSLAIRVDLAGEPAGDGGRRDPCRYE